VGYDKCNARVPVYHFPIPQFHRIPFLDFSL